MSVTFGPRAVDEAETPAAHPPLLAGLA